jgi:Tfp pilus assembly protein FimT
MVVIIVVVGLAIPALLNNWAGLSWRSVQSEIIADETFYSQALLEEIKSKEFVDPNDPNNQALGPNSGETYPNFDDVDDYNGFDNTTAGFRRRVVVDYVTLTSSTWQYSASYTDFKRIKVSVSRSGKSPGSASLETVVSNYVFGG